MDTPANRLKAARERKGIKTAAEAARRLGIKETTYQNYEDGSRGFSRHLSKLAHFYTVRPQWLQTGRLPIAGSVLEEKMNALSPADQEKAIEYIDMLAAKSKR